MALIELIIYC